MDDRVHSLAIVAIVVLCHAIRKFASYRWGKSGSRKNFVSSLSREGILHLWHVLVLCHLIGWDSWLKMAFLDDPIGKALGYPYALIGLAWILLVRVDRGETWGRLGSLPSSTRHRLVTKGLYSACRHPYYAGLGFLIMGVGVVLESWALLGVLLLWLAVSIRAAIQEERDLERIYGEEWKRYAEQVPFFLLPATPFMDPIRSLNMPGRKC